MATIKDVERTPSTQRLDPAGRPLSPTPTSDKLDPLNWNTRRKYTCIGIVIYSYFLLTYFTTSTIPSFAFLMVQLDVDYNHVNWTFALPCFGLAVGPLLVGALADTYGRRPVLILSTCIAVIASGCTAIEGINFAGYMAARFFQGLGAGPAANVGLCIINDLSWEHERGTRVGLWTIAANCGTIMGGVIGGLLAESGQWVAYHVTILYAVLLLSQCLLLPETLYPRAVMVAAEVQHNSLTNLKRTKQLGYFNLLKVPGVAHPKPWTTITQFIRLFAYPTVVISVFSYCFLHYWWICGITTIVPAAYEQDTPRVQGALLIGLLVGLLAAELFCSGHLSDKIMVWMTRKSGGERLPENRLWLGMPAAVVSSVGLLVWGFSIDKHWHWMTGQVAFFLYSLGLQMGNTTLSAYIVDNYPSHANEVITFYTVWINMSAFIIPWFIFPWVEDSGYTLSFAAQAIICTFGLIPAYLLLLKYGPRMRAKRPMYMKRVDGVEDLGVGVVREEDVTREAVTGMAK
ncbi:putative transporter [Cyphellophora attinorum]|uniref:Putative transporter n=1 Tax=Cyphellophora attinorum TaxID=1664694 RepID=A0A0N1HCT5_9EURO|nr:putative transporter [Phialophora attinorum]KPI41790.1 putative transporter [Phialophora attinorum]